MPIQPAPAPTHFDPEALRRDMFDSASAVHTVLNAFSPWLRDIRTRLDAAVASGEPGQVSAVAHTLRGGLAQMHAEAAVECVRALEAICSNAPTRPLNAGDQCLRTLAEELDALAEEVARVIASTQTPA